MALGRAATWIERMQNYTRHSFRIVRNTREQKINTKIIENRHDRYSLIQLSQQIFILLKLITDKVNSSCNDEV